MRAWLLLLAVLATFQTIVQVASTEDNNILSSTTTTAIQPFTRDSTTTTAIIKKPPSSLQDFQNIISTTKQKLNKQTVVYKTYNKSDKLSEKQENKNQEKQNQQQQEKDQENQNNKNIIVKIKNIEENEEINRNVLENEVMFEEESHKYNQNSDIYIKNSLKHKKMALIESEKIKNSKQNQKSQQTKQSNNLDEDRLLEENKESSSKHEHQHNHQHHQHQQHQQENLEPASQEQTTNTIISDKLKLYSTTTAATTTSSILSPITTPASSSPPPPPSSSSASSKKLDLDLTVRETDDGSIIVESQQPQLDAVIPDEGPRTFSNQEIIAEKVKPDNETLVVIENSLLSLFNMKVPPKIDRSKIIIPEAMKQLYAQIMGHDLVSVNIPKPGLLTKSANTVRSFTHQGSKIDDRFQHHHRFRLYFDIKSIPVEEKLKAAELQLTRDAISHAVLNPRLANRTRYQVLVYDITRVGIKGKREPNYLLLDNKTIRLNSTDTISLDVQPAVNRWLASPKNNFGLLVEVRTSRSLKPAPHHHVRLRRSADEEHEHWQHKQPLLFTYTDDGRHKARSIRDINTRSKRAGHHRRTHRRKNNDEICRRHSLYVDFTDVGWSDWIVAPPGYDAYYCSGRCPFPIADHLNSTNHAVVQTLVNSINPGKVPKACCVPTQLEGISMLYLNDHSTVVLKNYQDMTVVGCGCR